MNKKLPPSFWKTLHRQTEQALGQKFWDDIAGLIPIQGPRIDLYDTDEEVIMEVELPGVASPDQFHLRLHKDVLFISGKLERCHSVEEERLIQSERFVGCFQRKIKIPVQICSAEIKAQFRHGLLTVRLRKRKDDQPTIEIPIHVERDKEHT